MAATFSPIRTQGVKVIKTPFIPLPTRVTKTPLPDWQIRLIQRGHHGRCKKHIRYMDAPFAPLKAIIDWPTDFTAQEYRALRYGEIVYRGQTRYYEADL